MSLLAKYGVRLKKTELQELVTVAWRIIYLTWIYVVGWTQHHQLPVSSIHVIAGSHVVSGREGKRGGLMASSFRTCILTELCLAGLGRQEAWLSTLHSLYSCTRLHH